MLEALKVIIFGIVEGITEWLPISSTGHLILLEELLHLKQNQAFLDMFYVVIQLGAILAVVVMYFHKLNPFSPKKTQKQKMLFFFNDTATTEIYTLFLHDALPIWTFRPSTGNSWW